MRGRNQAKGDLRRRIVISATNIQGLGATQLVRSLLPALMRAKPARIAAVWIPDDDRLSAGIASGPEAAEFAWRPYGRRLPNAVSRVLECTFMSERIAERHDLLVLGDLPYRARGRQVVFVQTPFLLAGSRSASRLTNLKSWVSRILFRANLQHVHCVVVQTEVMRDGMLRTYADLAGRIVVIAQPAPAWLLSSGQRLLRRAPGQPLRLFFPASPYQHKNHELLAGLLGISKDVASLDLTIPAERFPSDDPRAICHGTLGSEAMILRYQACDALVMPSLEESYGLPLVEAMFLGLPVLAADRPYARALCGDTAIYFDPLSPESLAEAVSLLRRQLDEGWKPDWSAELRGIPRDWEDVAQRMLALFD